MTKTDEVLKAGAERIERLAQDPANVAEQLRCLVEISDWARNMHRDNFDGYLLAAAKLIERIQPADDAVRPTEARLKRVATALAKWADYSGDDAWLVYLDAAEAAIAALASPQGEKGEG